MKLELRQYTPESLWSEGGLPNLDSNQTLVLVFGAPKFIDNVGPINEIVKKYPNSTIVGCSTSGEIFGREIFDDSLSVAIIKFERTSIDISTTNVGDHSDSYTAGRTLADKLISKPGLRGIFTLSDGLNVNGSELVEGFNSIVSPNVIMTGGLAGDGSNFKRTWVLSNGEVKQGTISAVGLYGEHVKIGHGSKGGWDTFGIERTVTKSEKNILYELDDQPALELYKQYLGERARDLPGSALLFPLSMRKDKTSNDYIVRTILAIDEKSNSMTFAGNLPQGSLVTLMRANFDRLVVGAEEAATNAFQNTASPLLTIAISCVGRRLVLGEAVEEELESVAEALPNNSKQIGFYSYGEISPYASGKCDLHNQTMTLTTISEDE